MDLSFEGQDIVRVSDGGEWEDHGRKVCVD